MLSAGGVRPVVVETDFTGHDAGQAAIEALEANPEATAVLALSDAMAIAVLVALRRAGIDVPGRILGDQHRRRLRRRAAVAVAHHGRVPVDRARPGGAAADHPPPRQPTAPQGDPRRAGRQGIPRPLLLGSDHGLGLDRQQFRAYADPWHPFADTSARLAALFESCGQRVRVDSEVENALLNVGSEQLVVINIGNPTSPPAAATMIEIEHALTVHLAGGGGLLAVHVSAASWPDEDGALAGDHGRALGARNQHAPAAGPGSDPPPCRCASGRR